MPPHVEAQDGQHQVKAQAPDRIMRVFDSAGCFNGDVPVAKPGCQTKASGADKSHLVHPNIQSGNSEARPKPGRTPTHTAGPEIFQKACSSAGDSLQSLAVA